MFIGFPQSEQNFAVTLFSPSHRGSGQDTKLDRLNGGGGPSSSSGISLTLPDDFDFDDFDDFDGVSKHVGKLIFFSSS